MGGKRHLTVAHALYVAVVYHIRLLLLLLIFIYTIARIIYVCCCLFDANETKVASVWRERARLANIRKKSTITHD